jgi:hypothetical protein
VPTWGRGDRAAAGDGPCGRCAMGFARLPPVHGAGGASAGACSQPAQCGGREGAALGTPQREVLVARDRRAPDAARRRLTVPATAAARLGGFYRRVEELLLVAKAQWRWVRRDVGHMVWRCARVVEALRRSTQATTCGPRERPETAAEPPVALGGPAAPRAPPRGRRCRKFWRGGGNESTNHEGKCAPGFTWAPRVRGRLPRIAPTPRAHPACTSRSQAGVGVLGFGERPPAAP